MIRILTALTLCAGLATPAVAQTYTFEGTWDCQVATFVFTGTTYDNGTDTLTIDSIDGADGEYLINFPDGYQIVLADVTDTTMTWLSGASGDVFDCTRL